MVSSAPESRDDGQKLLSLEMAAARLGITVSRLRSMIACGAVRTLGVGGARFVPEGEVEVARRRLAGDAPRP